MSWEGLKEGRFFVDFWGDMDLRNHFNPDDGCVYMSTRIEELKFMIEDLCSPYAALLWKASIDRKLRKYVREVKDHEEYKRICEMLNNLENTSNGVMWLVDTDSIALCI